MNRILKINENQLLQLHGLIREDEEMVDTTGFSDADFVDAFVVHFRNWYKNKFDKETRIPFSYLISKYGRQYLKEMGLWEEHHYDDDDETDFGLNVWNMIRIGKQLISSGQVTVEKISQDENFLEKNRNKIEKVLKSLKLPESIRLNLSEPKPNELFANVELNMDEYLKSSGISIEPFILEKKIKDVLQVYLGIDFGKTIFGKKNLTVGLSNFETEFQEWKKTVFLKQIKPQFKNLPHIKAVRAFKLDTSRNKTLILKLSQDSSYTYARFSLAKTEIKNFLESLGYKKINVE